MSESRTLTGIIEETLAAHRSDIHGTKSAGCTCGGWACGWNDSALETSWRAHVAAEIAKALGIESVGWESPIKTLTGLPIFNAVETGPLYRIRALEGADDA